MIKVFILNIYLREHQLELEILPEENNKTLLMLYSMEASRDYPAGF